MYVILMMSALRTQAAMETSGTPAGAVSAPTAATTPQQQHTSHSASPPPREKQARLEGVAAALARTEHAATVAETGAMDASIVADGDEPDDAASFVSIFQASDSTMATSEASDCTMVMVRAQLEYIGPARVCDQLPAVFVLRPEVREMLVGRDCRGGLILNSSEQPNMISPQHAKLCWNESDGLWTVHRQLFLTGRVI